MDVTITLGKAGRLVVPKVIRESLGLREGTRLRLQVSAGKFEAVPEAGNVQIQMKDGFPVILGGAPREEGGTVRAIKADREALAGRTLARRARS